MGSFLIISFSKESLLTITIIYLNLNPLPPIKENVKKKLILTNNYLDIDVGVLQGTVLDPLLFLIYVNVIFIKCKGIYVYADDCIKYRKMMVTCRIPIPWNCK